MGLCYCINKSMYSRKLMCVCMCVWWLQLVTHAFVQNVKDAMLLIHFAIIATKSQNSTIDEVGGSSTLDNDGQKY